MESATSSKTAVMKPLFLKAGVPLVMSIAGLVCARFIVRRSIKPYLETNVTRTETIDSPELLTACEPRNSSSNSSASLCIKDDCDDDEEEKMNTIIKSSDLFDICGKACVDEEEIASLRNRVDELQKRELYMETKFLEYYVLKEQEFVLLELKGMLMLENVRVEFLDREVLSLEAEKQRIENLVEEYLRVSQQFHITKIENGLLQGKVKKLLKKTKEQFQLIREKNVKIEEIEAEVSRCCEKLETGTDVIKKLEGEVWELENSVNQLQEEKNEVLLRLNAVENSLSKVNHFF